MEVLQWQLPHGLTAADKALVKGVRPLRGRFWASVFITPALAIGTVAVLAVASSWRSVVGLHRLTAMALSAAEPAVTNCGAAQLSPLYVNATGALGSTYVEYGFRNDAVRSCVLRGYPQVQMLKASGAALSTSDNHAPPDAFGITAKMVTLKRGTTAYFGIKYARGTAFSNLSCPISAGLKITAPGTTNALVLRGVGGKIAPYGGTIHHLHCGEVSISPVTAKRFQ